MAGPFTLPDPLRADANPITLSIYVTELQVCVNQKREEIAQVALTFIVQTVGKTMSLDAIEELKERVNTLAEDFGFVGGVENVELLGRPYVDHPKIKGVAVTGFPIINDLRRVLELLVQEIVVGTETLLYGNFESPTNISRIAIMREFNNGDDDSLKINYLVNNVSPNILAGNFFDISTIGDTAEDTIMSQLESLPSPKRAMFTLRSFNKTDAPESSAGITFFVDTTEIGGLSPSVVIADKNFVYSKSTNGGELNIFRFKRSEFENTQMDSDDGTPIGDMTGNAGLSSAFDGVNSAVALSSARKLSNIGFVGLDWGIKRTVSSAKIYPSSDIGFTFPNSTPITFTLQASNDNFAAETVDLGTNNSATDITTGNVEITVSGSNDEYQYHRIKMEIPGFASEILIAEVQFFGFGGKITPDQILNIPLNDEEFPQTRIFQSGDKLYMTTREEDAGISYTWDTRNFENFSDKFKIKIIQKGASIGGGNFAPMSLASSNDLPIDPGGFVIPTLDELDALTAENPFADGRDRESNNFSVIMSVTAVDREKIYINYRTFVFGDGTKFTTEGIDFSPDSLPLVNQYLEIVPGTPTGSPAFCAISGNAALDECNILFRRQTPLPFEEGKFWIDEGSGRSTDPWDVEGHRGWLATASIAGPAEGQVNTFSVSYVFSDPPIEFNENFTDNFRQIEEGGILTMSREGGGTSKFSFGRTEGFESQVTNHFQESPFVSQGDFLYFPSSDDGNFDLPPFHTRLGLLVIDKASAAVKYGTLTAVLPNDSAPTQDHTFIDEADEPDGENAPFHTDLENTISVHDSLLIAGPKPPTLSQPAISDGEVVLNWSNQSATTPGTVTYNVWRVIGITRILEGNFPGTSTIIGGLTNGVEVSFVVNAIGVHGDSVNSNKVSVTPAAP